MEKLTPDKLAEIKEKLDKKLNYEKGSEKELEYTNKINKFDSDNYNNDRSLEYFEMRISTMKALEKEKFENIKNMMSPEEQSNFLEFLKTTLFDINNDRDIKTEKIDNLNSQKTNIKPTIFQKGYSFISRKENNANKNINNINFQTENVRVELRQLNEIMRNIRKLLPVYESTGGKRKTRRNRNKNKTNKKRSKSSRRCRRR
jgi:hypothetical protein